VLYTWTPLQSISDTRLYLKLTEDYGTIFSDYKAAYQFVSMLRFTIQHVSLESDGRMLPYLCNRVYTILPVNTISVTKVVASLPMLSTSINYTNISDKR